MKTRFLILCAVFIGINIYQIASAEVFKCKDTKGKTTYSDEPCNSGKSSLVDVTPYGVTLSERRSTKFSGDSRIETSRSRNGTQSDSISTASENNTTNTRVISSTASTSTRETCDAAYKNEKESIDSQMRAGYSPSQGEWFRERIRQIEKIRTDCVSKAKKT